MAANNKANVTTIGGVRGGYAFSAPVGTAGAPTKTNYRPTDWLSGGDPPAGWECLGFIVEDGVNESPNKQSGEAIKDINQEKLLTTESTADESITIGMREVKAHVLATAYGHQNVTDANGTIEVQHNWGKADEHYQYVLLFLGKNGRYWTKYVPDGQVTDVAERTFNKTNSADTTVTISYNDDEYGTGCYDWIDSLETPAPQLTALSGTGITLSPAFAAGTRTYTATSTATSTTLTATAGTGKTVAIKDGNGNSYSSGSAIPLVAGKNVLTIIVTDTGTGAKGTYALTITKS